MKQSQLKTSQTYPIVFDSAITPPHDPVSNKPMPKPVAAAGNQATKQPEVRRIDLPHWLIS